MLASDGSLERSRPSSKMRFHSSVSVRTSNAYDRRTVAQQLPTCSRFLGNGVTCPLFLNHS